MWWPKRGGVFRETVNNSVIELRLLWRILVNETENPAS